MDNLGGAGPQAKHDRIQLAVGAVGVVTLILGIWQIRNAIYIPLPQNSASANTNTSNEALLDDVALQDQLLKTKDTDSDSLSDYDELNIYRTSAYLNDTDSDGITDNLEIQQGADPLCAKGSTCTPVQFISPGGADSTNPTSAPAPTASEVRKLLKSQGATDADLAKYDDATLIELYNQVAGQAPLADSTAQPAADGAPSTSLSLTAEEKAQISKLSGNALREFLIKSGADEKILRKFDDTTLQNLVKQILTQ